jgi:(p)ppGpp synthase/HD superfamily hydrolase
MNLLQKTIKYSSERHRMVNHQYDGRSYSYHLTMVYEMAQKFSHLLKEEDIENVYCGCWVHDLIEDTRESYDDVMQQTNRTIAELSYALTNEKGKTRGQRGGDKYYRDMQRVPNAVFVKICDRLANISYSRFNNPKKLSMYQSEDNKFSSKLHTQELNEMFVYMKSLLYKN